MTFDLQSVLTPALASLTGFYEVCGIIDRADRIYPLGSDTKVLSTVFELITRPVVYRIAEEHGYTVIEPIAQITIPILH